MSGVATSSSFSVVFPITVPILLLLPFLELFLVPQMFISKRMHLGASSEAIKKITCQKLAHVFYNGGNFKSNFSKGLYFKHLQSRKV